MVTQYTSPAAGRSKVRRTHSETMSDSELYDAANSATSTPSLDTKNAPFERPSRRRGVHIASQRKSRGEGAGASASPNAGFRDRTHEAGLSDLHAGRELADEFVRRSKSLRNEIGRMQVCFQPVIGASKSI